MLSMTRAFMCVGLVFFPSSLTRLKTERNEAYYINKLQHIKDSTD